MVIRTTNEGRNDDGLQSREGDETQVQLTEAEMRDAASVTADIEQVVAEKNVKVRTTNVYTLLIALLKRSKQTGGNSSMGGSAA